MRRVWPLSLVALLACASPPPPADPCANWPATLAWAEEALALNHGQDAALGFTQVLGCPAAEGSHARARAGQALLAHGDAPTIERLGEFVRARKSSKLALAQALGRIRTGAYPEPEQVARDFCGQWSASPVLTVLCFDMVPKLDAPAIQAVLRAHGALGVLTPEDLHKLVNLDPQGATRPLQQCMSSGAQPELRDGDEVLAPLAYKLASATEEPGGPAARCLRRLGFDLCRRQLERGGTCEAPESVAAAIRDAAATGGLLELHRRDGALRSPIEVAGACDERGTMPSDAQGPMLMMHVALAKALERREVRGALERAGLAANALFSVERHRKCAQVLYCRHNDNDITGFWDYLPSSSEDLRCESGVVREIGHPPNPELDPEPDADHDAIADAHDHCPDAPETANGFQDEDGCPDELVVPGPAGDEQPGDPGDPDGDNVRGKDDRCPEVPEGNDGSCPGDGCPISSSDRDGDGVADKPDQCIDACETYFGLRDGCPDTADDPDGDKIKNGLDRCPTMRETVNEFTPNDGCPDSNTDHDGDGIPNDLDRCREEYARPSRPSRRDPMYGCPDGDGDGVSDAKDRCPTRRGTAISRGCPIGPAPKN